MMANGVWVLSVTRDTDRKGSAIAVYSNVIDAIAGIRRFIEARYGTYDETQLQQSSGSVSYWTGGQYYPAHAQWMTMGYEGSLSDYCAGTIEMRNDGLLKQKTPAGNG